MNKNKRPLIELLEDLTGPKHDDGKIQKALFERCLKASRLDLEEFLDDLSELLSNSPDVYLPTLQTFITHLCNEFSRAIPHSNLQTRLNNLLSNFTPMLITVVIIKNLNHSDIPGFGELLNNCIELLWQSQDNKPAFSTGNKDSKQIELALQTTKQLFSAILGVDGVLGVLVSGLHGRHCLKRVLFDFNMINQIKQEELLRAEDVVAGLLEKCYEHKEISSQMSETLSIYKACNALLETLRNRQNVEHDSLPPMLDKMVKLDDREPETDKKPETHWNANLTPFSIQDERHLKLLGMAVPRDTALEQRKTDLFRDLMKFLPCDGCHKRALIHFSPDKYSYLMENSADIGRLPFEFNEDEKLRSWDILLSEDTIKDIQQLTSPLAANAVAYKLWNISSGKWDKFRRIESFNSTPVYETELPDNGNLKILWQVDYGFSGRKYVLTQLVKVWAVTPSQKRISDTLENLAEVHFKFYTDKHIQRIKIDEGNSVLPKILEDEEDEGVKTKNDFQIDDEKLLEVHKIFTNKFIPFSKKLCKSLVLGGTDFAFQVSKDEYEIIKNPKSAIVIGRSGTGKTTCIVFKLFASYLNSHKLWKSPSPHDNIENFHTRQIFITVSPNLCHHVKEYFNRMLKSAELGEKKMTISEFHEYARMKEEEDENNINITDNQMLEEGDEEQDDIPDSFRQLMDHHFPLFITYKKFSKMLQGTYSINPQEQKKFNEDDVSEDDEFQQGSSFVNTSNAVDYKIFKKKYWPRLCDFGKLNKLKLDCELVYSEFSIIKGSDSRGEYLSREDYQTISNKKYPTFCHNRDQIYDLFQRYEKLKKQYGDRDLIDRSLEILHCAKTKALGGPHIHEIYVDECQDNNIVDIALILKVFDHTDAFFFSGDIAQCISRGSAFRFEDLSPLMYQRKLDRSQTNHNQHHNIKPERFELNKNYRSHNGILQLASSVIGLIQQFFPDSIDRLSREHGEIGGPLPIIFNGFQAEAFFLEVFPVDEQTNYIEFGAEQVIIVRDDAARLRLRKLIHKAGLVMTVFETKGMEFNDVLLYNFFTDSPAELKWRVVLSALEDHSDGIQTFSHDKHYILSTELKQLYVAVTRARHNLWVFDENTSLSEPIQTYWKYHKHVKVIHKGEKIPTLAKKSDSGDWDKKGKIFFERQQYVQAIFCFEKSNNKERLELATAYHLQQTARDSVYDSNDATVKFNFIDAAKAFIKCSRPNKAASCYEHIRMYKEAGDVYYKWNMFESAANCYLKANMWLIAGKCFKKSKKYTEAVLAYKDGGDYESVINLMQRHRQEIDEKIFFRITRLVNIHYRHGNNKEMSEKALSILPATQEEQIELLQDHASEELIEVCEKSGQFCAAAAEVLRSRGKFIEAADKFINSANKNDIIEALQCLLHLCRVSVLKFTMIDIKNTNNSQELHNLLSKIDDEIITKVKLQSLKKTEQWENLMEEVELYLAYLDKNIKKVYKCIEFFRMRREFVTEFRAINICLQILPQSAEYWHDRLQCLLRLCELAFPFIDSQRNADNNKKIYKDFENIFFVNEVENCPQKRQILFDNVLVCLINEVHSKNKIEDTTEIVDNWHVYDVYVVHLTISQFLASHIYQLIWETSRKGRDIPNIGSYICFCKKQNCRKHHVIPTPSIIHQRLELACFQYTVIRQLDELYRYRGLLQDEQSKNVLKLQREWAEKLVEIHIRYHSPQISCPEITYMVLAKLPKFTRNGLISLAYKIWLLDESKNANNFDAMLKCMFVFQQLHDKWGVNKFYWEMSKKTVGLSDPTDFLPDGFEYQNNHGWHQAIPVGKRLSSFFFFLYSNREIEAISEINTFIQYTINNTKHLNMANNEVKTHSFGDLVTLIEFAISLIFAIGPGNCDFCIPRAYLVNLFYEFTAVPLIPNRRCGYNNDDYLAAIKNSFNQVKQLLKMLICNEQFYLTIILRLIRLLILIGLNESTFASKVITTFKSLYDKNNKNKIFSIQIKKYLEESYFGRIVFILRNDLKEIGCDSLVIVHYNLGGSTKFSLLEKQGTVKLTYTSISEFHSALQQIMSPVVTELNGNNNKYKNAVSTELSTEIQVWFRQINDSSRAQKAARKIQAWLRRVHDREKSRQLHYDPILDKVYNDVRAFCQTFMRKKERKVVKYNILLKGLTVDIIVELINLQDEMERTKNKLKKSIKYFLDPKKIESCLELEDELKYIYYENVKLALESLLTTENSAKHKEVNTIWLKNELQQAKIIIDQIREWMTKCNEIIR